jgi:hypothetical protein
VAPSDNFAQNQSETEVWFPPHPGVIGCVEPEDYPAMLFEGEELREIIGRTTNAIELRNEYGRCYRFVSSAEALALDLNLFIGIGNRHRIRSLRRRTQQFALNAGSHTTQRLRGEGGKNIAHPLVREHRPVLGKS